jgi:hypothetical protein
MVAGSQVERGRGDILVEPDLSEIACWKRRRMKRTQGRLRIHGAELASDAPQPSSRR